MHRFLILKIWVTALFLLAFSSLSAYAELVPGAYKPKNTLANQNFGEVEMPAGSVIPVYLLDEVSTETSRSGTRIEVAVAQDLFAGKLRILSKGDRIDGSVTRLEPPIRGRNAILKLEFDRITLSGGGQVSMNAITDTGQESHYWGGELTEGTQLRTVPYDVAGIGTYGRAMPSGPRAMGQQVSFRPGDRFMIIIQEPLQLYPY